ncbi:hypothetical protein [Desulfosporosinus shakirovi]|uniref:hypothetical protein n=1 Tax=Desulfosporosinus shakirovi TaxID=2885154 RepID=UPI001E5B1837|nr:hypothetical protein [Desulfosporosinus sp. SRJS8]MCB8818562.1 hypothetical protein [Desulfosporosinus sp. SRJS8]
MADESRGQQQQPCAVCPGRRKRGGTGRGFVYSIAPLVNMQSPMFENAVSDSVFGVLLAEGHIISYFIVKVLISFCAAAPDKTEDPALEGCCGGCLVQKSLTKYEESDLNCKYG